MNMRCDCCNRRKKLLESFEEIDAEKVRIHLCVDCSNHLYQIRDLIKENDVEALNFKKIEIEKKMKKASSAFKSWYQSTF